MKSTSGYVFTLGEGAVSWKSSKQTCITRSTMEVKFIALEKTSFEASGLVIRGPVGVLIKKNYNLIPRNSVA